MDNLSTREQIITAADDLFYRHGFEATSFADIAGTVGISRGNFYYYFKTKDEILTAVIERRLEKTSMMLEHWEIEGETPQQRIRSFIHILIGNQAKIKKYDCPIGTLCTELAKLNHAALPEANKLFTLFRSWLRQQFLSLGCKSDADKLAMHLLARSQGIATLASAFHDEKFIKQEVQQLNDWLDDRIKRPTNKKRQH